MYNYYTDQKLKQKKEKEEKEKNELLSTQKTRQSKLVSFKNMFYIINCYFILQGNRKNL